MGAISVPVHVSADGNSRICFDPSSGGNGAPVLSFALNMKIPIAALVAALTEYQHQVVEDELMSRASQALAIPADHSPPDPGDRSLDARMPPPPVHFAHPRAQRPIKKSQGPFYQYSFLTCAYSENKKNCTQYTRQTKSPMVR